MKKQITHISVNQSSKLVGVLYFFLTAIVFLPAALVLFLLTKRLDYLALTLIPFALWLCGYVFFAAFAWIYNFAARTFGGIEYDTVRVEPE